MRTTHFFGLMVAWIAFGNAPAFSQVQLQSRTLQPSSETTAAFLAELKAAPGDRMRGLATFSRIPTGDERKTLEAAGVRLLTPLSGLTYRVSVEKRLEIAKLKIPDLTVHLTALTPADRVESSIWRGNFSPYRFTPPGQQQRSYVVNADGTLTLTVRMHPDVLEADSKALLTKHAVSSRQQGKVTWIAVVTRDALQALAAEDAVQWIDSGPLPYFPENDATRVTLNVDTVQNFNAATGQPQGIGGSGVQVGVFDKGIDQTHPDYATRVIADDVAAPSLHWHSTHLGCTVAGGGNHSTGSDSWGASNGGSSYQWRGMAPLAKLIDADQFSAEDPTLHLNYITNQGMHLSLHSYKISFDGAYDEHNQARDALIRGDAVSGGIPVPPRLHVVSAGNDGGLKPQYWRDGANQRGYFSLTKQLKNALMVGSWAGNYASGQISTFSSLGPAHDGRIKPDVVAPGNAVTSCGGCPDGAPLPPDSPCPLNGASSLHQNYYRVTAGTSIAAAATAGVAALVLEQYGTSYAVNIDQAPPLPSTLRAIIIHTARDVIQSGTAWPANPEGAVAPKEGPDFVSGWGLVDAKAAVDIVKDRRALEGIVPDTCHVRTYMFQVSGGMRPRVTLAWDDPAADSAAPRTDSKLVNDLDLVLVAPNGTQHYPWKLDQKIVNSLGNDIPDADQYCGTAITVQRDFTPVANPVYDDTNPANNVDDTIPGGVVPYATRGRDHLNNVERVDVRPDFPAMPGTWLIKVSGFKVAQGPQKFSLVGADFVPLLTHPTSLCVRYPLLCTKLVIRMNICERFPKICEMRFSFPNRDFIRIQFTHDKQKVVLPIDSACYALNCPPCAGSRTCSGHDLEIASPVPPVRAAIYASNGDLVMRVGHGSPSARAQFRTQPGERYFLVLTPGPTAKPGVNYDVGFRLR